MVRYNNILKRHFSSGLLCNGIRDDISTSNELRRSLSRSSHAHGGRSNHYLIPTSSNSEVQLCRKKATTMICLSSLPSQQLEASSADSLIQVRRNFSKTALFDKSCQPAMMEMTDSDENQMFPSKNVHKAESMPYAPNNVDLKKSSIGLMSRSSLGNSLETSLECKHSKDVCPTGNLLVCKEVIAGKDGLVNMQTKPNQAATYLANYQQFHQPGEYSKNSKEANLQSIADGTKNLSRMKAQIDNILTLHSERGNTSLSNVATDFSRALLQKLLNRGKDKGVEFVVSPSCLDGGNSSIGMRDELNASSGPDGFNSVADSATELAKKLVSRMNEIKEFEGKRNRLQYIKNIFDKIIASSPGLSNQLDLLRDTYGTTSNTPDTSTLESLEDSDCMPVSESLTKLLKLEAEVLDQESVLSQLFIELKTMQEDENKLEAKINSEEAVLTDLNQLRKTIHED